jgi:PAS domain S-box-containing protein
MKDKNWTEMQLINEPAELRKRISELETLEKEWKQTEDALRQNEERYRTILESMQEVYYEIDLSGNWIFLNEAFYEHLGYRKEELIGRKSRQYQDETTARELYEAYTRLYRTGEPIRAIEAKWISKDGTKRTYEMSASLIRDREGNPIGFRGISRDITERKRMEEERERLIHELQDALANVKTLRGLLPICSNCKKIRDDKGYWNQIESYIQDHSGAEFSHSMCPECVKKLYPDLAD